ESPQLYLRAQDTGALHFIEGINFGSYSGSGYPAAPLGGNSTWDHLVDQTLIPGTYDLIYRRLYGSDPLSFYGGSGADPYPFANRVLATGIVIGAGMNTLDIDIPTARATGAITLNGGALPESEVTESPQLYLRARDTGALHFIDGINFGSYSGTGYPASPLSSNPTWDHLVDQTLIPGTYDLIYRRLYGSDPLSFYGGSGDDPYPFANRVIASGIVIGAGLNALDIDIPTAWATGAITLDGGPLPESEVTESPQLYLRAQDTGALHFIDGINFGSYSGTGYPASPLGSNPTWDHLVDQTLVPGTYDLIYRRHYGSDPWSFYGGSGDDPYPFANRVIASNLVIGPGMNALDIDIPTTRASGPITLDGGPLPESEVTESPQLYLRARDTGALHFVDGINFGSHSGTGYPASPLGSNPTWDHLVDQTLIPGDYDLIYRRHYGSDPQSFYGGSADDPYPFANRVLQACVAIP
ncbi:MAG: hypothetical protein OEY14_04205, partial [Myxococcales bacterium]|nr:hypothetical protein [Myxococcales bacterium]